MNDHAHTDSHHEKEAVSHAIAAEETPSHHAVIEHLPPIVDALLHEFEEQSHPFLESSKYQVSKTVSLLAAVYEKARNAVEFRADHLIRRAAIERIVKRRILLGGSTNSMGENVIVELLWARYLDSSQMDDAKVAHVQTIIDKYLVIKQGVYGNSNKNHNVLWDTLVGLMSSEIDEILSPAKKREALTNFFYQAVLPKVRIPNTDEKTCNILTYIAVERAFAESDDTLILFHLLKLIQPSWLTASSQNVNELLPELFENIQLIEKALKHRVSEPLSRYIRKQNPPFLLLRDFLFQEQENARSIIVNEHKLEQKLTDLASKRYLEIGTKVRRAVVRSIVYIFLTKMLFALALEAPFDIFITKKVEYLSIAINSLFPPILLFFIAGFIKVPGADNSARLVGRIKRILYSFDDVKDESNVFQIQEKGRRPMLTAVFSIFYLFAFVLSFGFISYTLTKLHFNVASQIIFIFFVTLVSFFAYRIRLSASEYEMGERHGVLSPLVDFFFVPILRVGRALSSEIAKLNVFMFIFDFILEAPLKVVFDFMEEWFRFIRTKKDEIV